MSRFSPDPKPPYRIKEPKPLNKARKVTGEGKMFSIIGSKRKPVCQVCGLRIAKLQHFNFAHLLSKGAFPAYRLNENNILIMCYNVSGTGCHTKFDCEAESVLMEESPARWKPIFELKEKLKREYNKEFKGTKFQSKALTYTRDEELKCVIVESK